jgi:polysaccharide biosynthesis/export protein
MNKNHYRGKPITCKVVISLWGLLCTTALPAFAQTSPSQAVAGLMARPGAAVMTEVGDLPALVSERMTPRSNQPRMNQAIAPVTNGGKHSFEAHVEQVVDRSLNVFGKELFNKVADTFAPVDAAQVNPDYVIGAGDELQIRGWGMIDIDVTASVDRSGTIYLPRVGAVKVAGVKYRDLQDYLRKAVSKIYTNFDLTVSVAQTRAVQIYVVGHAVRPGTYTVSAMSTLLNTLFVSGGPNGSGTMRNIQVKRGGATVTTFDMYDMLVNGDKSHDIAMQDGDVIYIPEVGPLVALSGDVKNPAIFELKGSSSIADVINWAGGIESAADLKQIIVEKNVDNQFQTMAELTAEKAAIATRLAGIAVRPADILRVFSPAAVPVQAQIQNEYVRVVGEVKKSGVFKIKQGETLRELIARLGGVTENAYIYATRLNRESVRREQQKQLDEVVDRFEREVEMVGSNRIAGTADTGNVAIVTAELTQQRHIAQKMRAVKAEGRIVLELPGGASEVKHLPDLVMQNGDSIVVPRKPGTVNVLGAVFQQNSFIYRPHRIVSDYLELAGGPAATADKSAIYLIRADGTAQSTRSTGWFRGIGGAEIYPGDTVVVPEAITRESWTQNLKEWTSILYQFGLGAAGLKALQN